MKCIECDCCHEVTLSRWSSVEKRWIEESVHQCWGVKEPFVVKDINKECTEYEYKRNKNTKEISVKDAIGHFVYGINYDIFKEPVTSYAKIAVDALRKQIPTKPVFWEDKYYFSPTPNNDWGYECPCCGNREIDYPEHHCICGQALDWSEFA